MSTRPSKGLFLVELLLLLLPATLATTLIVALSYPAYPPPVVSPLNLLFDAALLIKVLALVAAWRAALLYVRHGPPALRRIGAPSRGLVAAGAVIGLMGALFAAVHMLGGPPHDAVGFALLAPGAVLLAIGGHLWAERRRASRERAATA